MKDWVEIAGALLAVAYLLLAIRQQLSCWIAYFLSSGLYVWIFFNAHLYMDSGLNAFYAAMAVYGFLQWRRGTPGAPLRVCHWPVSRHALALAAVAIMSLGTSLLLRRYTPAAWPFIDSLIAWSSVVATFLVARKIYENWHWWLAIDSLGLVVYSARHLYVTSVLFAVYLVLIAVGMRQWRRSLDEASAEDDAHAAR